MSRAQGGLVVTRAKDFRDSGDYEVWDGSVLVTVIHRDPETRWWFERPGPGRESRYSLSTENRVDALRAVARRYRIG